MNDLEIKIGGIEKVRGELGALLSADGLHQMNREVGINIRERTADHLARASVTRHKVADRLGAKHTKFLEFAPARGRMRGDSAFTGQKKPYTEVENIKENSVEVVIGNTPGLRRAFGAISITPVKAKALTIPLHKISYAKRVADLRSEGIEVFRPKGTNILAMAERKGKKVKVRPLYALVKRTALPQDAGLLPTPEEIAGWAKDSMEQFIAVELGD